jgi:addiction module HigA family antidote
MDRDWTVHPGELLAEKLEELGMTQTYLAMATGYTQKHINQVVRGHVGISPTMALALERELDGISARMWVRLQADYDLDVARGIVPKA